MLKGRNWFRFFSISIIIGIFTPIAIGMIFIIHASIVVVGPELFNSPPELTTKEEKMLSTLIAPKFWTQSSAWVAEHWWPYRNGWLTIGSKDETEEEWHLRRRLYHFVSFKRWAEIGYWIERHKFPSKGGWLTTASIDETPWEKWWREQLYGVIAYLLRGYERDEVVKKWPNNTVIDIGFMDDASKDPVIRDQVEKVSIFLSNLLKIHILASDELSLNNITIISIKPKNIDHPIRLYRPDYLNDPTHERDFIYKIYGEYRRGCFHCDPYDRDRIEGYGTYFTHAKRNRVKGVGYSNENHEINQSKCYVWYGHSEQRKRELITECLIRSLGIFGANDSNYNPETASPEEKRKAFQVSDPADLDTSLLRFLHSDRVRPGMTIHDLIKLAQSPSFNKFFEE